MPIFRRQDEAPRERTPEERERARLEREARRTGRPVPPVAERPEREARRTGRPVPPVAERPPAPSPSPSRSDVAEEEPQDVAPAAEEPQPPLRDFTDDDLDFAPPPREEEPGRWEERAAEERDLAEEPRADDPPDFAPEPPRSDFVEPEEPVASEPVDAEAVGDPGPAPLQPTEAFDPLSHDTSEGAAVGGDEPTGRPPIVPPAARRARPAPVVAGPDERPVGAKRVSARDRRLPPPPPPPGAPAFAKRRRRRARILAGILLVFVGLFLFGLNLLFQPFKGDGGETVTVRIPPNSTVADVGDLLDENEIVDSSFLFVVRARLAGADLKAGTYRLKKDQSYGDALDALGEDPAAPRTIRVVIPEGRSRQETAPLVKQAGLEGSYLGATDRQKGFRPARFGAPRDTNTLEGFLFPATYELKPGARASALVGQQLATFREKIREVDMTRARRRGLDVYDVLIIASMVEREASLAKERPLIAAVVYNRLREGMPLQLDATIRYATRNWKRPIRQSELESDSPFNTYRRTGLPPTPIGSPGISSIKAAAAPADVDFLFYVLRPCGEGAHNFSDTDAEFARDKAAYDRKREELGGNSPIEC